MTTTILSYFLALEDLREAQRAMVKQSDAFRAVHLDGVADDLDALADKIDAAVDRLMENSEAESAQAWADARKQHGEILSDLLRNCIEEDEARAKQ